MRRVFRLSEVAALLLVATAPPHVAAALSPSSVAATPMSSVRARFWVPRGVDPALGTRPSRRVRATLLVRSSASANGVRVVGRRDLTAAPNAHDRVVLRHASPRSTNVYARSQRDKRRAGLRLMWPLAR